MLRKQGILLRPSSRDLNFMLITQEWELGLGLLLE